MFIFTWSSLQNVTNPVRPRTVVTLSVVQAVNMDTQRCSGKWIM